MPRGQLLALVLPLNLRMLPARLTRHLAAVLGFINGIFALAGDILGLGGESIALRGH